MMLYFTSKITGLFITCVPHANYLKLVSYFNTQNLTEPLKLEVPFNMKVSLGKCLY